ncbi:MAG: threonine-phosphate decarboxylase CobD [Acidobacteria bacterium]|nr:threonine-phosphate decarboxylase CobD [Acidobacteriota bacterium]
MPLVPHGGDIFGAARRLGVPVSRLLDFSANINPLGLSPKASRRLRRELHSVCHYPDQRQEELRHLIASKGNIDPECVVFGNGATQLLYLIPRSLKPRKALLIVPGFPEYHASLVAAQSSIREFRLRAEESFSLKPAVFLEALDKQRPDLVLLANPNNPTGTVVPRLVLLEIAGFCRGHGAHFIVDESFIDFTQEVSLAKRAVEEPGLIVVRSLTKFFALPGLRIGYLVAHRSLAQTLGQTLEPWSVNTLALVSAAESIKDAAYRKRSLALVARERDYLLGCLKKLGWMEPFPTQTNFVLARIKSPQIRGGMLRQELEGMHLLIRDSCGFKGLGPQFVRFAVRTHKENKRLISALRVAGERFSSTCQV